MTVRCRACGKIAKIMYDDPGIDDPGMAVCKNRKCANYNDFANVGSGEYFKERYEVIV